MLRNQATRPRLCWGTAALFASIVALAGCDALLDVGGDPLGEGEGEPAGGDPGGGDGDPGGGGGQDGGGGQGGGVDVPPSLVLWNELGSAAELATPRIGPAISIIGSGGFHSIGGRTGFRPDAPDKALSIPGSVVPKEQGTLCVSVDLISVPAQLANATEYNFVKREGAALVLAFLSNDGRAHSGWLVRNGGVEAYSRDGFGNTPTDALGASGDRVHACVVWSTAGVLGAADDKIAVVVNGQDVGTHLVLDEATALASGDGDLILHNATYNPDYAAAPPDIDVMYDEVRIYNEALSLAAIGILAEDAGSADGGDGGDGGGDGGQDGGGADPAPTSPYVDDFEDGAYEDEWTVGGAARVSVASDGGGKYLSVADANGTAVVHEFGGEVQPSEIRFRVRMTEFMLGDSAILFGPDSVGNQHSILIRLSSGDIFQTDWSGDNRRKSR